MTFEELREQSEGKSRDDLLWTILALREAVVGLVEVHNTMNAFMNMVAADFTTRGVEYGKQMQQIMNGLQLVTGDKPTTTMQ